LNLLKDFFSNPSIGLSFLGQVFRNAGNLPFLWLLEIGTALILIAITVTLHKVKRTPPETPG